MRRKRVIGIGTLLALLLVCCSTGIVALQEGETELEITEISGTVGAISVEIKNIGTETANEISSITTVTGGLFNSIELTHECSGCEVCGTTLDPGAIKTENTREAGFLFGFGTITVSVTASANNADAVSTTVKGTIIGPFIII